MTDENKKHDAILRAKWELARITTLALEDAGMTATDVAGEVGEAAQVLQNWIDGRQVQEDGA